METKEFTRKELIAEIYNHSSNQGYNNNTNAHDLIEFKHSSLTKMSDSDLIEVMMGYCSWNGEVEISII